MPSYSISKQLNLPFNEAVDKTITAFKERGFGVLSDIDVKATLKEKMDIDRPAYRILGMCNPPRAHKALEAEPEIGLLLPCNVIVYENETGSVTVAAIKPSVAFSVVDNDELAPLAEEVETIMQEIIESL